MIGVANFVGQQRIDQLFPLRTRGIGEECLQLVLGRQQSDQIEIDPPGKTGIIHLWRTFHSVPSEIRIHEAINRVLAPLANRR